ALLVGRPTPCRRPTRRWGGSPGSHRPMPAVDYDPLTPRDWDDPYPTYRRLREEAPVHHAPGSNTYTISRYDDVVFALKPPEIFSSASAFDILVRQIAVDLGWRDLVAFARFLARARVSWKM